MRFKLDVHILQSQFVKLFTCLNHTAMTRVVRGCESEGPHLGLRTILQATAGER